jgi:hypothetical protein
MFSSWTFVECDASKLQVIAGGCKRSRDFFAGTVFIKIGRAGRVRKAAGEYMLPKK